MVLLGLPRVTVRTSMRVVEKPAALLGPIFEANVIGIIITTLTCIVVPMSMFAHWQLSKGNLKIAYPTFMCAFVLYMIIETTMALTVPTQISVLLFNIPNAWAFYMAYRGMRRLKKEKKDEQARTNPEPG